MVELLDHTKEPTTDREKQINRRYRLLMWIFVFVNPLFFGWTHYLFGREVWFIFVGLLLLFYPIGLFIGTALLHFFIRFAFDIGIVISKSIAKHNWGDQLLSVKTRLITFEKKHNLPIGVGIQVLIFIYLFYHFRFSSFYDEVFIPTFFG